MHLCLLSPLLSWPKQQQNKTYMKPSVCESCVKGATLHTWRCNRVACQYHGSGPAQGWSNLSNIMLFRHQMQTVSLLGFKCLQAGLLQQFRRLLRLIQQNKEQAQPSWLKRWTAVVVSKTLQTRMLHLLAHLKKRMATLPNCSLNCQLRYHTRKKGLVASLTMAAETVAQMRTADRAPKKGMLQDLLGPFSDECLSALRIRLLSCI